MFKIKNKRTGKFSTAGRYPGMVDQGQDVPARAAAEAAIKWYNRDEEKCFLGQRKEYSDDLKRNKHRVNKWRIERPSSRKEFEKGRFYRNAEVVEFAETEVKWCTSS